jgi:hypothetical protein
MSAQSKRLGDEVVKKLQGSPTPAHAAARLRPRLKPVLPPHLKGTRHGSLAQVTWRERCDMPWRISRCLHLLSVLCAVRRSWFDRIPMSIRSSVRAYLAQFVGTMAQPHGGVDPVRVQAQAADPVSKQLERKTGPRWSICQSKRTRRQAACSRSRDCFSAPAHEHGNGTSACTLLFLWGALVYAPNQQVRTSCATTERRPRASFYCRDRDARCTASCRWKVLTSLQD